MNMLDKFRALLRREKKYSNINLPKHVAITMDGIELWARKNDIVLQDSMKKSLDIIKGAIELQIELGIPIFTFYLLPENLNKDSEYFSSFLDSSVEFFNELSNLGIIHSNHIKISILGKWYTLPGRLVEPLKRAIDSTKEYDNFFLNFCINYSGQEEIVDACKLIIRQVQSDKLDFESISKDIFRENIYSSYFVPPDIIIINGLVISSTDILMWDSASSKLFFTKKLWPDFSEVDFIDAIREFQKG